MYQAPFYKAVFPFSQFFYHWEILWRGHLFGEIIQGSQAWSKNSNFVVDPSVSYQSTLEIFSILFLLSFFYFESDIKILIEEVTF